MDSFEMETRLAEVVSDFEKTLDAHFRISSGDAIERKGHKIIIPEDMSHEDAAYAILEFVKSQNEEANKVIEFICHPDDGLANFDRALTETFGGFVGRSQVFFFGLMKKPSQTRSVKIGYDESITVPYGNVAVPGLPIQMDIGVTFNRDEPMKSKMVLDITYKKKYEPIIELIEKTTREYLRTHSIFRGKAINSNFEFINPGSNLTDKLVYSELERKLLGANLFNVIKSTSGVRKLDVAIKRTLLLKGKFGTGKTLTANYAAQLCMENGWTFINVIASGNPVQDIVNALRFAIQFEPCMVFYEDIDDVASGKRNADINEILNTVDGILNKASEVLTVFTTNNADRIERGLLRPGRIDEIIELGTLDAVSMGGLVRAYVGERLQGKLDIQQLLGVAKGYTPSFVAEACKHALLYAWDRICERDGAKANPGKVKITNADILTALQGLQPQYDLMEGKQEMEDDRFEDIVNDIVEPLVAVGIKTGLEEFKEQLNPKVLARPEE